MTYLYSNEWHHHPPSQVICLVNFNTIWHAHTSYHPFFEPPARLLFWITDGSVLGYFETWSFRYLHISRHFGHFDTMSLNFSIDFHRCFRLFGTYFIGLIDLSWLSGIFSFIPLLYLSLAEFLLFAGFVSVSCDFEGLWLRFLILIPTTLLKFGENMEKKVGI